MSYLIGSFNIRDFNLSNSSTDGDRIERDFEKIAAIIIGEKFDIVAIQEVNAEIAIRHLTEVLNRKRNFLYEWDYDFSGKAATTINDPEGYGFIWNKKRFRLLDIPRKNNPTYYNSAGGKDVLRPPYYGRFTARGMRGGSNFELRLVNVHIRDTKKEADRIAEFDVLVRKVLPRICELQELPDNGEMMPAYTFLAGDYNLRLDKGERANIRIDSITPTNYTGRKKFFKTVQEQKTSLRVNVDEQGTIDDCYANNYDHFTYDMELIRKMNLSPSRVEALGKYFSKEDTKDKLHLYRKRVSDHVPIVMNINLKK